MEIFHACCGASTLRSVDDSLEIKPCQPIARPKKNTCVENWQNNWSKERTCRHPINITRVRCHEGDDMHPLQSEVESPKKILNMKRPVKSYAEPKPEYFPKGTLIF